MPPLGLSKGEMLGRTMLMVLACIRCCIPGEVLGSSWPRVPAGPILPCAGVARGHVDSWKANVFLCSVARWKLLPAAAPSCLLETANFPIGCDRFQSCSSAQTSRTRHKDRIPFTHFSATGLLMQPCHQHVLEPPQDLEIAITRPCTFSSSCTELPETVHTYT